MYTNLRFEKKIIFFCSFLFFVTYVSLSTFLNTMSSFSSTRYTSFYLSILHIPRTTVFYVWVPVLFLDGLRLGSVNNMPNPNIKCSEKYLLSNDTNYLFGISSLRSIQIRSAQKIHAYNQKLPNVLSIIIFQKIALQRVLCSFF